MIFNFKNTRETPAFGGISLALRGSGAFGGGKRKKKKHWGVRGASSFGRLRRPIVLETSAGS